MGQESCVRECGNLWDPKGGKKRITSLNKIVFISLVSKYPESTSKLFCGNESILEDLLIGDIISYKSSSYDCF